MAPGSLKNDTYLTSFNSRHIGIHTHTGKPVLHLLLLSLRHPVNIHLLDIVPPKGAVLLDPIAVDLLHHLRTVLSIPAGHLLSLAVCLVFFRDGCGVLGLMLGTVKKIGTLVCYPSRTFLYTGSK